MPVTRPILLVAPPALDGATGYLDDLGGGHTFTLRVGEFPEATARIALTQGAECPPDRSFGYTYLTLAKAGYRPYRRDGVQVYTGQIQIRVGVLADPARLTLGVVDTLLPGMELNIPQVQRAFTGQTQVVTYPLHDPAFPLATSYGLVDALGPIRGLGATNFCALRDLHDGNPVWLADMDTVVKAGYNLYLVYRALGFDGDGTIDSGYFAGRGVSPLWLPTDLPQLAAAAKARGLRLILSCGHKNQSSPQRFAWERAWMEALVAHGLADTIHGVIGDNEFWQNADFGATPRQLEDYQTIQALMRDILGPAGHLPFFACGAPESEATDAVLFTATAFAQVVSVHVTRETDMMVRHTFNAVYDDNQWRVHKHWQFDEPTPFVGGPDDFMPTDSAGRQVAQAAIGQLTGGTHVYFDGYDVKSPEPIDADAPTFWSIPKFLAVLGDDVAQSTHIAGGRIWWWRLPDGRWATVVDELWGRGAAETPAGLTLGRWKAYGPFNTTLPGEGALTALWDKFTGFGGALVVSET